MRFDTIAHVNFSRSHCHHRVDLRSTLSESRGMIRTFLARMKGGEKCPPRQPLPVIAWSWVGAFTGISIIALLVNNLSTNPERQYPRFWL